MFLTLPGNSWLLPEPLEHLLGSRACGRRSTLPSHCSLLHHHTWDIWFSFHDFNLLLTRTARSMSRWFVVMVHVFLEWRSYSKKKKKKFVFICKPSELVEGGKSSAQSLSVIRRVIRPPLAVCQEEIGFDNM